MPAGCIEQCLCTLGIEPALPQRPIVPRAARLLQSDAEIADPVIDLGVDLADVHALAQGLTRADVRQRTACGVERKVLLQIRIPECGQQSKVVLARLTTNLPNLPKGHRFTEISRARVMGSPRETAIFAC